MHVFNRFQVAMVFTVFVTMGKCLSAAVGCFVGSQACRSS
jgi:hypothetical protein